MEVVDGVPNLVDLNGRVNHESDVGDAETDDLNRVLRLEGIPDQKKFVNETEQEKTEKGGNRLELSIDGIDVGPCSPFWRVYVG